MRCTSLFQAGKGLVSKGKRHSLNQKLVLLKPIECKCVKAKQGTHKAHKEDPHINLKIPLDLDGGNRALVIGF